MHDYDLLPDRFFRGRKLRQRSGETTGMLRKVLFITVMLFSALFSVFIFLDILYWVFN
jgi:hypothetical protein